MTERLNSGTGNPLYLLLNVSLSLLFVLSGCNRSTSVVQDMDAYVAEIKKWQADRMERLKSREGWLNLAGLYWLEEGENTF